MKTSTKIIIITTILFLTIGCSKTSKTFDPLLKPIPKTFDPLLKPIPAWLYGEWSIEIAGNEIKFTFTNDNVKCKHVSIDRTIRIDFNSLAESSDEGIIIKKSDDSNFEFSVKDDDNIGNYKFEKVSSQKLNYIVGVDGIETAEIPLTKK